MRLDTGSRLYNFVATFAAEWVLMHLAGLLTNWNGKKVPFHLIEELLVVFALRLAIPFAKKSEND